MNQATDLVILKHSLWRRAVFLRQLINVLSPPLDAPADRLVSYAAVEALNTWTSFARVLFVVLCEPRSTRERHEGHPYGSHNHQHHRRTFLGRQSGEGREKATDRSSSRASMARPKYVAKDVRGAECLEFKSSTGCFFLFDHRVCLFANR